MGVKFTNNAIGYLAAPITDTATSLTLGAGEGNLFPQVNTGATDYFYVTITDVSGNREIVKVQLRSAGSNVLAELVRAQDGTAARAFDTGDIVDLRIPAVVLTEWETEIETNASDIATNAADIATNAAAIANITSGVEETGNKMYFYQAAAPTVGWVIDATIEDVLLAVVDQSSGGLGYDITAGNPGGSWTPTLHTAMDLEQVHHLWLLVVPPHTVILAITTGQHLPQPLPVVVMPTAMVPQVQVEQEQQVQPVQEQQVPVVQVLQVQAVLQAQTDHELQ